MTVSHTHALNAHTQYTPSVWPRQSLNHGDTRGPPACFYRTGKAAGPSELGHFEAQTQFKVCREDTGWGAAGRPLQATWACVPTWPPGRSRNILPTVSCVLHDVHFPAEQVASGTGCWVSDGPSNPLSLLSHEETDEQGGLCGLLASGWLRRVGTAPCWSFG